MKKVVFRSRSVLETIRIGKRIGTRLRPGDVVALTGQLGAGKTHLIKGLAYGVGVKKPRYLSSPSFTLINEYPGRIPFYHIDLYRLESEEEAEALGLEEYLRSTGITAIEWADKIPSLLPEDALWVAIDYAGERERRISLTSRVEKTSKWLEELSEAIRAFEEVEKEERKGMGPEGRKGNPLRHR